MANYFKVPTFDAANVASKLPEPMRQPGGFVLQLIKDLVVEDDPMPNPTPLGPAAGMVTRFIKGGVPDKALREAHTQKFLESAQQFFKPEDLPMAEQLVKTHPRIAAHTKLGRLMPNTVDADLPPNTAGRTHMDPSEWSQITGADPGRSRIPVTIDPSPNWTTASETLPHEMSHVAQALGNKDANILYSAAGGATGYARNPFEVSARRIADRKMGKDLPPASALTALKQIAENPRQVAQNTVNRPLGAAEELSSTTSGNLIDLVLKMREAGIPRSDPEGLLEEAIFRTITGRKNFFPNKPYVPGDGIDVPMISPYANRVLPQQILRGANLETAGRIAQQSTDDPEVWNKILALFNGERLAK